MQLTPICWWWIRALAVIVTVTRGAQGRDFAPNVDLRLTAVRATTGEHLWTSKALGCFPEELGVTEEGVLIHGRAAGRDAGDPMVLGCRSGVLVPAAELQGSGVMAKAKGGYPHPEVRLQNGWVLSGDKPTIVMNRSFVDAATGEHRWTLAPGQIAHNIRAHRDTVVFVSDNQLKDSPQRVWIQAHLAGSDLPSWSLILNEYLSAELQYAGEASFELAEGLILGQVKQYLFAVAPSSEALRWQCDLASTQGLSFYDDFCKGGVSTATILHAGSLTLLGYEGRVLALDLNAGECLWHLDPDCFPHGPLPLAHDGVVYFVSGAEPSVAQAGAPLRLLRYTWGFRTEWVLLALGTLLGAACLGLAVALIMRLRRRASSGT